MRAKEFRFGLAALAAMLLLLGLISLCTNCRVKDANDISYLIEDVVAKLSGHSEIKPGLRLGDRFTLENKEAARVYLKSMWRNLGLDVRQHNYITGAQNIYAVLKATELSDEYAVLGAHYDTVPHCPGANDDATGVALVTAVAAELSKITPRRRNLIFVLFDEEEQGRRGSLAFAQKIRDEAIKVLAVHTVDQMGWDNDHDRAIELELPYEGAVRLYKAAANELQQPIPIHVTQTEADHSSFRRLDFPSVGFTEEYRNKDTTPFVHTLGDSFDTVQFEYLDSTTRLVVHVMKMLIQ